MDLKGGTTQVTLARFVLKRDMDLSFDDDQYLVLTQDDEEKEGDNEVISYWSEDNDD